MEVIPSGALSLGLHQYLYGTTIYGNGSIYCLVPPSTTGGAWTQLTIYKFKGGTDGAQPLGTLAVGQNGTLYGVTKFGGTVNAASAQATGCGTVFRFNAHAPIGRGLERDRAARPVQSAFGRWHLSLRRSGAGSERGNLWHHSAG